MINFKQETLEAIRRSGHTEKDVMFIGADDGKYRVNIEKFKEISDFEYDSGFGSAKIPTDMIIYFKDKSYIKRGEYNGGEWWEYNTPLKFSDTDNYESFEKIPTGMWTSLSDTLSRILKKIKT